MSRPAPGQLVPVPTAAGGADAAAAEAKFVRVPVTPDDRVETVAARHGLTAMELRQVNQFARGLSFDYFLPGTASVWVPRERAGLYARPPPPTDAAANAGALSLRAFLAAAPGAAEAEARYYLDEAGAGGVARALSLWREDNAWEAGGRAGPAAVVPAPPAMRGPPLAPEHAPSAPPPER